ncbi:hypothetical protein [uncultured Metabacillus sp.]|uniref:hypothetical protein n=1 Tax=uncultured Metabacillus sp. TaxID=2860135 RepID=UPI002631E815|nr:hypothetical protein [uncultured Metabacillus sp.]
MKKYGELNAYLFIYKRRLTKIKKQYILAFSILFDKVTILYLVPFFVGGLILFKESIQNYTQYFYILNQNNYSVIIYFTLFLFLFYLSKSYFDPRYKVTSSDFHLSLITYDLEKIIKIIILQEQIKRLIIFSTIITVFYFLRVLSFESMFLLIISFAISDLFSGLTQWKLFQRNLKGIITKITYTIILIFLFMFIYINFLRDFSVLVFFIYNIVLLLMSIIQFKRKLTSKVNWNQVIPIGDDKTWNLLIVKLITGVGFNIVPNRVRLPALTKVNKVDNIPYELSAIVSVYWKRYLIHNKTIPFNIIGNCVAILLFLSLSTNISSGLNLAIPTLIGMYLLYGIFKNRLDTLQFKVLPMSANNHVNGFYRVTFWFILVLLLPHFVILLVKSSLSIWLISIVIVSEWIVGSYIFKALLHLGILNFLKVKKYSKAHHLLIILLYLILQTFLELLPLLSILVIIIFLLKSILNFKNIGVSPFQFEKK